MKRFLPFRRLLFPALVLGAMGTAGKAAVLYSNLQSIAIPTDFTGVYLDLDTGITGTNDSAPPAGWDLNAFFGGQGVANSALFQPARNGAGASAPILRLNAGAVVSDALAFGTGDGGSETHLGSGANQFASGQEAYLGFHFTTNANAGPYYGWMRVVFTADTGGAKIQDWAYDTSGGPIVVGRIQQSTVLAGTQLVTLSPATGESFTLGSAVTDRNSHPNRLLKTGGGLAILGAANSFSGTTEVQAGTLQVGPGTLAQTASLKVDTGGTLLLGGAGDHLPSAAPLELAGGTLALNGVSEGTATSAGLGALTLSATSTIDFGLGDHGNLITFGGVGTHTAGTILKITNWDGAAITGDGDERLLFAGSAADFLAAYAPRDVTFNGLPGYALVPRGALFEVTAIPEPNTLGMGMLLLGLVGWNARRVVLKRRASPTNVGGAR